MQCSPLGRWWIAGLVVAALVSASAQAAPVPPEAVEAAETLFRQDFEFEGLKVQDARVLAAASQPAIRAEGDRKASAAMAVDPRGKIGRMVAEASVPASQPAYLTFDVAATKPGRLVVHLQPAELPKDLAGSVQKEDWADPRRSYDFRALVDLPVGQWRSCSIDLNKRVFEAITRDKRVYDLAGLKIKSIGFSVNQPGEAGQQVLVDNVRLVAVGPEAQRAWLAAQLEEVRGQLEDLDPESAAARHWRPVVHELNMTVMGFDPKEAAPAGWRDLRGRIEQLALASAKWSLAPDQPYLVGAETSLRRVSGRNPLHAYVPHAGLPVSLEAARNEYESFQVVILPVSANLEGVTVRGGDLARVGGEGAIAAKNLRIYHQVEQYIQPSLRTTDDQVGWTPDALLPVTEPFDVKDLETRPLWVTLYVPADTAAGEYAGAITIKPANAPEQKVELKVKVHDLSIPKVGQFRTQGHFGLPAVQQWYGERYSDEVRKAWYRLLVEHRFSPTSQYSRMLSPVEEDIPWVMAAGGNVIVIGGYHTKDLEPERIDGWYRWLVDNNFVDKALIYVGDETDDYKGIRRKAEVIRAKWPKLRIMVGGSKPRPELEGYVDIWDPITSGGNVYDFDPKGSRDAQARGEEMFWYTCIGPRPPFANCCNDDPLTAIRALWWQAWKYGITGFEYWGMNQWDGNFELAKGEKPWPLSRIDDWNSRSYAWCNGDGLMVYPGPDGQPLSCNRFSVMRDAIEDWEVLFQLQRAVELAQKGAARPELLPVVTKAKRLLDVPAEVTADLTHWSEDPQVYLKHRRDLYELLATLRGNLGAQQVDEYTATWIADHQRWLQQKFEARVAKTGK